MTNECEERRMSKSRIQREAWSSSSICRPSPAHETGQGSPLRDVRRTFALRWTARMGRKMIPIRIALLGEIKTVGKKCMVAPIEEWLEE
jgi:hypothetical protein